MKFRKVKEIENFFHKEIRPHLSDLERRRKRINQTQSLLFISSFLVSIFIFNKYIVLDVEGVFNAFVLVILYLMIYPFFAGTVLSRLVAWVMDEKRYILEYKNRILQPVIKKINPDFEFSPDGNIEQKEIKRSLLIQGNFKFEANNQIEGMYKEMPVKIVEIEIKKSDIDIDKDYIFSGLLIRMPNPFHEFRKLKGVVYFVSPENEFGDLVREQEGILVEKVELNSLKQLNFYYDVFATHPEIAIPLLENSTLSEEHNLLTRKVDLSNLVYAFSSEKINISLNGNGLFFEPDFSESLLDIEHIYRHLKSMRQIARIIEKAAA